jgi:hypothetical protein
MDGRDQNKYRTLVGKPNGKIQLLIPRRGWDYNIKIDLKWNRI